MPAESSLFHLYRFTATASCRLPSARVMASAPPPQTVPPWPQKVPWPGPRTVVWLNEAHHCLGDSTAGERIAAAVHHLLTSPQRGSALVLGTLWPDYFKQYTSLPTAGGSARVLPCSAARSWRWWAHCRRCRTAAARARLSKSPAPVEDLALRREEAGDREGAENLARQAADHGRPDRLHLPRGSFKMLWPYGLDPDGTPSPPWQ